MAEGEADKLQISFISSGPWPNDALNGAFRFLSLNWTPRRRMIASCEMQSNGFFAARGLPTWLQSAHWRIHSDRVLQFRACDDAISFSLRPQCGMPQGAPESPAIYASLSEALISMALEKLALTGRPAGVAVPYPTIEHDAETVELAIYECFPTFQCCIHQLCR